MSGWTFNPELFRRKVTTLRKVGVWLCFCDDLPRDCVLFVVIFQLPQVFAELGIVSPLYVPE